MLFISFMAKVRSLSTVRCAECTHCTVFRNSLPDIEKNERTKTYFTFLEKKDILVGLVVRELDGVASMIPDLPMSSLIFWLILELYVDFF